MALVRDAQKIKIRVFMEVIGWPAEKLNPHLEKIIKLLQDKMEWKITKEKYEEPKKLGEKTYNTHVEFEAELNDFTQLFSFALSQGPSVIEVLEPSEIYLTAGELQDILAEMVSKAQTMDKEIKILSAQNRQMGAVLKKLDEKGLIPKKPSNDEKSSE